MGLDIYVNKVVSETEYYFGKVNFLVKFFEEKGMDVEHQVPYTIQFEDLEDLVFRCTAVLDAPELASNLLPTMEGFFFGSTDYNLTYYEEVEEVLKMAEELLEKYKNLEWNADYTFNIWY